MRARPDGSLQKQGPRMVWHSFGHSAKAQLAAAKSFSFARGSLVQAWNAQRLHGVESAEARQVAFALFDARR